MSESIIDTLSADRIFGLLQILTKRYLCHKICSPLPALHTCKQLSTVLYALRLFRSDDGQTPPFGNKASLRHTLNILYSDRIDARENLVYILHAVVQAFLAPKPGGDLLRSFKAQHNATTRVGFDALQFVGRYRRVAEPQQLCKNSTHRLLRTRRVDTSVDYQIARLGITIKVTTNIVGQALLLANGLKEAGAHAVAEYTIDKPQWI